MGQTVADIISTKPNGVVIEGSSSGQITMDNELFEHYYHELGDVSIGVFVLLRSNRISKIFMHHNGNNAHLTIKRRNLMSLPRTQKDVWNVEGLQFVSKNNSIIIRTRELSVFARAPEAAFPQDTALPPLKF